MSVNSTPVSANKPTRSVSNDQTNKNKTAFSPRIEGLHTAKKKSAETSLIGHNTLVELAKDFKNGYINKEQVNERFVSAVIEGSVSGHLGEKDRKSLAKDIAEFFADDPDFINRLQKNLRDLC
jgi:hypothetical protein